MTETLAPRRLAAALALAVPLALAAGAPPASAASFVFEGRLEDRGQPADGRYDLRVNAFASQHAGAAMAMPVTLAGVAVAQGRFRTEVELPIAGDEVWLALEVRASGESTFSAIPARSKAIAAPLVGQCWSTLGDVDSDPLVNFIGTTDAQPFVIRTRNAPSLRIEPSTIVANGTPITNNIVAGASLNRVATGVRGATISGGGVLPGGDNDPDFTDEQANVVSDHYGTIGGGYGHRAGGGTSNGTVADDPFATVAGGFLNFAQRAYSTVGGGLENRVFGDRGTVAGGESNAAGGDFGAVAGGFDNFASGLQSFVGGGSSNNAQGLSSVIAGGFDNFASSENSVVSGGSENRATGIRSVVAGGILNVASSERSTVSGGALNEAVGNTATISGGRENTASGQSSTVVGGTTNTASGDSSTVGGGIDNCAGGSLSWAGGRSAKVRPGSESGAPRLGCAGVPVTDTLGDRGTFAWADAQVGDFVSTGDNQFLVRASGGIWLGTTSTVSIPSGRFLNTSTGGYLSTGGTWVNASSRALKTDFAAIDPVAVLARVLELDIGTWTYRAARDVRHLGPVAEDFHALFGLGNDAESISTVDASGVALAALKGLNQKLEDENAALRAELARRDAAFEARLERLERAAAHATPRER